MPSITLPSDPSVTLTYEERVDSRSGQYGRRSTEQTGTWYMYGSSQEEHIIEGVLNAPEIAGPTAAGHVFDGFRYDPIEVETCDWWYITAFYVEPQIKSIERGEARFRWTVRGSNQKISVPRNVNDRYKQIEGATVRYSTADPGQQSQFDLHQGIGDDGKKGFRGAEILFPTFGFAYDFKLPGSNVTAAYVSLCAQAVGKINSTPFGPANAKFPARSVLCSSINGTYEFGEDSTLAYEFQFSPRETNLPIGDLIIAEKDGWQFVDVYSETEIKNKVVVNVINQVNILDVYEEFDMNSLGIPGTA